MYSLQQASYTFFAMNICKNICKNIFKNICKIFAMNICKNKFLQWILKIWGICSQYIKRYNSIWKKTNSSWKSQEHLKKQFTKEEVTTSIWGYTFSSLAKLVSCFDLFFPLRGICLLPSHRVLLKLCHLLTQTGVLHSFFAQRSQGWVVQAAIPKETLCWVMLSIAPRITLFQLKADCSIIFPLFLYLSLKRVLANLSIMSLSF